MIILKTRGLYLKCTLADAKTLVCENNLLKINYGEILILSDLTVLLPPWSTEGGRTDSEYFTNLLKTINITYFAPFHA